MKKQNIWLFMLALLALMASCKKEDIGPIIKSNPNGNDTVQPPDWHGVFVLNEGNYTWGNGSLTWFNPKDSVVKQGIFENKTGVALGDVPQSIVIEGDMAYIVVNNSGKIELLDLTSMKSAGRITGLASPREFLKIDDSKAYVTDLYADAIHVLNLNQKTITGTIKAGGWTEALVMTGGRVFVTNMEKNMVQVIDPTVNKIIDSVKVGIEPNSMVVDANGNLWVLCSGGFSEDYPALYQIDPSSLTVLKKLVFNKLNSAPSDLTINNAGDYLYFINGGVYGMDVSSFNLPSSPVFGGAGQLIYSIGVHPQTGELYLGDALDYVQPGRVLIVDPISRETKHTFQSGINPGDFGFYLN